MPSCAAPGVGGVPLHNITSLVVDHIPVTYMQYIITCVAVYMCILARGWDVDTAVLVPTR